MEFKLTINDGAKSYKKIVKEPETNVFVGLKVGAIISGDSFGFNGYEFMISGGSDKAGFPMHKGVNGAERAKILRRKKQGNALRKTVMGNTISEGTSQINLTVTKKGKKELKEIFEVTPETPAE